MAFKLNLTQLSLRKRILLPFSLIVVLLIALPLGNFFEFNAISRSVSKLNAAQASGALMAETGAIRSQILQKLWSAAYDYEPSSPLTDVWITNDIKDKLKALLEVNATLERSAESEEDREIIAKVSEAARDTESKTLAALDLLVAKGHERGTIKEAVQSVVETSERLGDLIEGSRALQKEKAVEADELVAMIYRSAIIGTLVTTILAFLVTFWCVRVITQTSRFVSDTAGGLETSSNRLEQASSNIVKQASQLSSGASEGASAVQEMVSTLQEVSAMLRRTMEHVTQSNAATSANAEAGEKARKTFEAARKALDTLEQSIDVFAKEVHQQNNRLSEVVDVIKEIASKTAVINDIVFQTKLLSFNASVEAARAGENGRGFAVVAEEVGNLAKMSGLAAKEISSMVGRGVASVSSLIQSSQQIVDALATDAKARTSETASAISASSQSLEAIVTGIRHVQSLSQEVLLASREQTEAVSNITAAMSQVDETISGNAHSSQVLTDTAEEVHELSMELRTHVASMQQEVHGQRKVQAGLSEKKGSRKAPNTGEDEECDHYQEDEAA